MLRKLTAKELRTLQQEVFRYEREHKLNHQVFARLVGVSHPTIYKLFENICSDRTAALINKFLEEDFKATCKFLISNRIGW